VHEAKGVSPCCRGRNEFVEYRIICRTEHQCRLLEDPATPVPVGAVINTPASPSQPLLVKLQVSSDMDERVDVATYNAGTSEQKQFFRIFAHRE